MFDGLEAALEEGAAIINSAREAARAAAEREEAAKQAVLAALRPHVVRLYDSLKALLDCKDVVVDGRKLRTHFPYHGESAWRAEDGWHASCRFELSLADRRVNPGPACEVGEFVLKADAFGIRPEDKDGKPVDVAALVRWWCRWVADHLHHD